MNGVLGHLCANIGYTGPGEPPEDGEMNEMTLPFRHMNLIKVRASNYLAQFVRYQAY